MSVLIERNKKKQSEKEDIMKNILLFLHKTNKNILALEKFRL
jgi:hypothetical protein